MASMEDKIAGLYAAFFNRAPDMAGFEWWSEQIGAGDKSLEDISAGFSEHIVFETTYGDLNNEEFVNEIYVNMTGNNADSGGLEYYVGNLNNLSLEYSRSDMVADFIGGVLDVDLNEQKFDYLTTQERVDAQNRQILMQNKVLVAQKFVEILGNYTNVIDLENVESDPAYLASKKILSGVGLEGATVSEALDILEVLRGRDNAIEILNEVEVLSLDAVNNKIEDLESSGNLEDVANSFAKTNNTVNSEGFVAKSTNIIQSLYGESNWEGESVTYSFNDSIPSDYTGVSVGNDTTVSGNLTTGWQSPSLVIRDSIDVILEDIGEVIGIDIEYVERDGDIRFNMIPTADDVAAFAYFPANDWGLAGDVFIDTGIETTEEYLGNGGYGDLTITHELGHAFGLKHPFEDGAVLPQESDNYAYSIMSYTDYKELKPVFTKSGNSYSADYEQVYPESFMLYDVATLQGYYGANLESKTANDIYSFGSVEKYMTIWDGGGVDTIDLSGTTAKNILNLNDGTHSDINYMSVEEQIAKEQETIDNDYFNDWVEQVYMNYEDSIYTGEKSLAIAYGVVMENAIGGSSGDVFYDNEYNNKIEGGDGDDIFYLGSGGYDEVLGGDGSNDKIVLGINFTNARMESVGNVESVGQTLLVGDDFAVILSGVEFVEFADMTYAVA